MVQATSPGHRPQGRFTRAGPVVVKDAQGNVLRTEQPHNAMPVKRFGDHRDITKAQRQKVKERFDHQCPTCGTSRKLFVDFIVHPREGGKVSLPNLTLSCRSCSRK